MRSIAAAAVLAVACAQSPVSPSPEPSSPSLAAASIATPTPGPAPDSASYTWETNRHGGVWIISGVDTDTTVLVIWWQWIDGKGWRHNHEVPLRVPAHGEAYAAPDCFYYGRYQIEAPGHGLRLERDFGPSLGQPYCGTGPGTWTW